MSPIENIIFNLEELIARKQYELNNLEDALKIIKFITKHIENKLLNPEFEKYFRENFWDLLA